MVFNGDADGLCAAHQLRLAGFAPDRVVTGVKRDIGLLARVEAAAGDQVRVADISLDANREALMGLIGRGVAVEWFDHHHAGEIPAAQGLAAHIDLAHDTCSSLIVDRLLGGRHRAWAVAAAFGDNLHGPAAALATAAGLEAGAMDALRELGELLNYNAYGESVADLHVPPQALFERMAAFADPLDFIVADPTVPRLRRGFADDMAQARAVAPLVADARVAMIVLPCTAWARRVNGVFANELARGAPQRAHAVLVDTGAGYVVSVRAALARPDGADTLCRQFATGGGRARAAGINLLPVADLERFAAALRDGLGARTGEARM
jgi:hypothetical protein